MSRGDWLAWQLSHTLRPQKTFRTLLVLDYISRDLNVDIDSIAVSSVIYDLDWFFYIPVAESQEQKEMLIKRQNFSRGDFHSDILDSNFRKLSSSSKYCLFFSYLMDGVLLAEIYKLQRFTKHINYSFIVATSLGAYAYMLIISKEYKIVKSHRIELDWIGWLIRDFVTFTPTLYDEPLCFWC